MGKRYRRLAKATTFLRVLITLGACSITDAADAFALTPLGERAWLSMKQRKIWPISCGHG
jgi:hypothetical protein